MTRQRVRRAVQSSRSKAAKRLRSKQEQFISLMFGEFDISEVGFEDMTVGHVPVEDGAQQKEGIHEDGAE